MIWCWSSPLDCLVCFALRADLRGLHPRRRLSGAAAHPLLMPCTFLAGRVHHEALRIVEP